MADYSVSGKHFHLFFEMRVGNLNSPLTKTNFDLK